MTRQAAMAALSTILLMALSGCQPADEGHSKAVIGAVLIDGAGGPPLADSAVIVAKGQVQWTGSRMAADIPAGADTIDGSGKYLVPALVDAYKAADPKESFAAAGVGPQGAIQPATAEQARQQVSTMEASKPESIHLFLDRMARPVAEAVLDAARAGGIAVTAHLSTQGDARLALDGGATRMIGMIRDTTALDDSLVMKMRDLRILVAPALSSQPANDIAKVNTKRLFTAGVPIAAASSGGDLVHEAELLVDAGIPPLDVIVAASRGGGILPGKPADMLMLSANPGQDIGNLRRTVKLF